jgi:hypothetical protein
VLRVYVSNFFSNIEPIISANIGGNKTKKLKYISYRKMTRNMKYKKRQISKKKKYNKKFKNTKRTKY